MRYFIDAEFLDDGTTVDLISLGIVADDGRELYACNLDAQLHRCHASGSWMRENVLAQLPSYGDPAWLRHRGNWQVPGIREAVCSFMLDTKSFQSDLFTSLDKCQTRDQKPIEIWGYYSSYDWVVFCQLFGRMIDLPPQFPKRCRDLKQFAEDFGVSDKLPKPQGAHNALVDARWNRDYYKFIKARLASCNVTVGGAE